jgi:hypothetical protein
MNLLRPEEFHSPGSFHVTEPGGLTPAARSIRNLFLMVLDSIP